MVLFGHPNSAWGFRMTEAWKTMDSLVRQNMAYKTHSLLLTPDPEWTVVEDAALVMEHMLLQFNVDSPDIRERPQERLLGTAL
jgi:hypothetical protein